MQRTALLLCQQLIDSLKHLTVSHHHSKHDDQLQDTNQSSDSKGATVYESDKQYDHFKGQLAFRKGCVKFLCEFICID